MRTLSLLAALLLLALQAQAEQLGEKADQVPAQDEPGAKVQDMTISFEGDERSTRDASASRATIVCHCSRTFCRYPDTQRGTCTGLPSGTLYRLCCR